MMSVQPARRKYYPNAPRDTRGERAHASAWIMAHAEGECLGIPLRGEYRNKYNVEGVKGFCTGQGNMRLGNDEAAEVWVVRGCEGIRRGRCWLGALHSRPGNSC